MKPAEFANSVDPDEAAHDEPPYQDLHCLLSSLRIFSMIQLGQNIFHDEPPYQDLHCLLSSLRIFSMIQLGQNIFLILQT